MLLAVAQRRPWLLHPHPLLLLSTFRSLLGKAPFCSSSTAAPRRPPVEAPRFMVEYLISAGGLSTAEATKAARYVAHHKSTAKPEAVLRLMRQECLLGDAQIRRLLRAHPTVLMADPERTLRPKIKSFLEAGFSGPELARLIATSGVRIPLRDVLDRIEFWRSLLGGNESLLKAVGSSPNLLAFRLEEKVLPTLTFLRSVGVPNEKIRCIIRKSSRLFSRKVERLEALVEQVKSFGISPGSAKFVMALRTFASNSKPTLEAKMSLLRSLGLSQAEVVLAIQRFPAVLCFSHKKIQAAMDFLLGEAGCSPAYVAGRPVIIGFSMERRLVPRFRVMESLRTGGLPEGDHDLYNVIVLSDKKFREKYIAPNMDKIPGLLNVYLASGGKNT